MVGIVPSWCYDPYSYIIKLSRSEEHTSELQSRPHLVCRLLLEKKKKISIILSSAGTTLHSISRPYPLSVTTHLPSGPMIAIIPTGSRIRVSAYDRVRALTSLYP